MSLKKPFLLTVLICGLLIICGSYALPIQADEREAASTEGMTESAQIQDNSGMAVESPTHEISDKPAVGSDHWRIIGIIIGICSLLTVAVIYLIKQKKI